MLCGRWSVTESSDVKGLTEVPTDVIHWEPCENGEVPSGAVIAGKSEDNEVLFIGRARLRENRNELTPGMVVPSERCLLLSYGTGVRKSSNYEVLVAAVPNALSWVHCAKGHVPPNAVIGGIDCSYLEPLYVGRTSGVLDEGRTWRGQRLKDVVPDLKSVMENGRLVQLPGKVHRTHRCLYIPHSGKEYLFRDYEVLVMRQNPVSLLTICRTFIQKNMAEKSECGFKGDASVQSNLDMAVNEAINALPIPTKLKEFCKLGNLF